MRLLSFSRIDVSDDPQNWPTRIAHPNEFRVVLSSDTARHLQDVASYDRDLRLAAAYMDHYTRADIDQDNSFGSPLDALWTSALVMYGRAFATGVRSAPKPRLDHLTSDQTELHEYLIDVRNKYVAHSANGFEQSVVVAFLFDDDHGRRALSGVAVEHTSLSRISRDSAREFTALCEVHLTDLRRRAQDLTGRVVREVLSMGADQASALPRYEELKIDQNAVRKRRRS